jgi:hypothetical protein
MHASRVLGKSTLILPLPRLSAALQKKRFVHLPRICIQLLLPDSQLNLDSLLSRYAAPAGHVTSRCSAASRVGSAASGDKAATDAGISACSAAAAAAAAAAAGTAGYRSGNASVFGDVLARVMLKASAKTGSHQAGSVNSTDATTPAAPAVHMQPAADHSSSSSIGSSSCFWQLFSGRVTVICVTEVKYSLIGLSCLACPGAVTLVSNLVHSVDSQALLHAQCEEAPMAVQEYLQGSTNELYEVRSRCCSNGVAALLLPIKHVCVCCLSCDISLLAATMCHFACNRTATRTTLCEQIHVHIACGVAGGIFPSPLLG